jgi:subtilisin family serine protease
MLLASGVVEQQLITALEDREPVRAIILFATPGTPASSRIALGANPRDAAGIRSVGQAILDRFAPGEFELIRRFPSLGALAGRISREGLLRTLEDPNVRSVGLDPPVVPQLAEAVPHSSLDLVHDLGFTGEGVTVAVVDSGIDTDHPDLSDDLIGERCFCSASGGCCPDGSIRQSGPGSAEDDDGHGTSAAGIITSRGILAPPGGAPDAEILAIKATGTGLDVASAVTDVLFAGHWIRVERPDVDVISMSLVTPQVYESPCDDYDSATWLGAAVVDQLRANGVVLLASSGNAGSGAGMGLPACLSGVIGVGAVYDDVFGSQTFFDDNSGVGCTDVTTQADQVTCFSNSDPTTVVFASGANVVCPALGGGVDHHWGGTSAAAPLAASCAALLKQKHPEARPASIEMALRTSQTWVTDPKNGLSFPRLDCAAALAALPRCDDGEDNDGDGLVDHPNDPGCFHPTAGSEDSACQDGDDNDLDGTLDFDGGLSALGHLAADPDPQCVYAWQNDEEACGAGAELALLLPLLIWSRRSRCATRRET